MCGKVGLWLESALGLNEGRRVLIKYIPFVCLYRNDNRLCVCVKKLVRICAVWKTQTQNTPVARTGGLANSKPIQIFFFLPQTQNKMVLSAFLHVFPFSFLSVMEHPKLYFAGPLFVTPLLVNYTASPLFLGWERREGILWLLVGTGALLLFPVTTYISWESLASDPAGRMLCWGMELGGKDPSVASIRALLPRCGTQKLRRSGGREAYSSLMERGLCWGCWVFIL